MAGTRTALILKILKRLNADVAEGEAILSGLKNTAPDGNAIKNVAEDLNGKGGLIEIRKALELKRGLQEDISQQEIDNAVKLCDTFERLAQNIRSTYPNLPKPKEPTADPDSDSDNDYENDDEESSAEQKAKKDDEKKKAQEEDESDQEDSDEEEIKANKKRATELHKSIKHIRHIVETIEGIAKEAPFFAPLKAEFQKLVSADECKLMHQEIEFYQKHKQKKWSSAADLLEKIKTIQANLELVKHEQTHVLHGKTIFMGYFNTAEEAKAKLEKDYFKISEVATPNLSVSAHDRLRIEKGKVLLVVQALTVGNDSGYAGAIMQENKDKKTFSCDFIFSDGFLAALNHTKRNWKIACSIPSDETLEAMNIYFEKCLAPKLISKDNLIIISPGAKEVMTPEGEKATQPVLSPDQIEALFILCNMHGLTIDPISEKLCGYKRADVKPKHTHYAAERLHIISQEKLEKVQHEKEEVIAQMKEHQRTNSPRG